MWEGGWLSGCGVGALPPTCHASPLEFAKLQQLHFRNQAITNPRELLFVVGRIFGRLDGLNVERRRKRVREACLFVVAPNMKSTVCSAANVVLCCVCVVL